MAYLQGIIALFSLELELYLLNIPEYNCWDDCSRNRPTIAKNRNESAHGFQPHIYKGKAEAVSPMEEWQVNYDEKDQFYRVIMGHGGMNPLKI